MSTYLDFHFDKDCVECVTGCARVVPKSFGTTSKGLVHLSHDCCTMSELEHVLTTLEQDIADIRKRAKAKFAKVHPRSAAV